MVELPHKKADTNPLSRSWYGGVTSQESRHKSPLQVLIWWSYLTRKQTQIPSPGLDMVELPHKKADTNPLSRSWYGGVTSQESRHKSPLQVLIWWSYLTRGQTQIPSPGLDMVELPHKKADTNPLSRSWYGGVTSQEGRHKSPLQVLIWWSYLTRKQTQIPSPGLGQLM